MRRSRAGRPARRTRRRPRRTRTRQAPGAGRPGQEGPRLGLLLARRGRLVLRRALRYQRVALAAEAPAPLAYRDDHLAPGAKGVGYRAGVVDRHLTAARAVLDGEGQDLALAVHRSRHDGARQLVAATGLGLAQQLSR